MPPVFVADHFLHTSGIMAVLGAGLAIGHYGPVYFKTRVQEYLKLFWEDAAFVTNSLIFLMLGLSEKIFLANTYKNVEGLLIPTLTAILVVLFARGVVVYTLIPLVNAVRHRQIDDRYKALLAWGGLRGAPGSQPTPACAENCYGCARLRSNATSISLGMKR
jgi:CPA1 family monovalent cation:H+ antiporter